MQKLLDIYITHWTEPYGVGQKMLTMLSLQRNVNWKYVGINIIHDGSEKFPDELFENYPFTVRQICLPHGGISAARNYAINDSDAVWIKFCDFDDEFAGVYSLSCIMNALPGTDQFDMLWFPLIIDMSGETMIVECSPVFIHDKVYRVSFLKENNIYFNTSLYFSEDFAFSCIVRLTIPQERIGNIDSNFPIYLYIIRHGSVGNRYDLWYKNRCGLFDAQAYIQEKTLEHGEQRAADILAARCVYENYLTIIKAGVQHDTSELKQKTFEYYDQHKDSFDRMTDEDVDLVIEATNKQNNANINKNNLLNWIKSRGNEIYESDA